MIGGYYNRPIWNALQSTNRNAPEITATLIETLRTHHQNSPQELTNQLIGKWPFRSSRSRVRRSKKFLSQLKTNSPQSLEALAALTDAHKGNKKATKMTEGTITKKLNKTGFKEQPLREAQLESILKTTLLPLAR